MGTRENKNAKITNLRHLRKFRPLKIRARTVVKSITTPHFQEEIIREAVTMKVWTCRARNVSKVLYSVNEWRGAVIGDCHPHPHLFELGLGKVFDGSIRLSIFGGSMMFTSSGSCWNCSSASSVFERIKLSNSPSSSLFTKSSSLMHQSLSLFTMYNNIYIHHAMRVYWPYA